MKNVEDVYRLSPVQRALLSAHPPGGELEHMCWNFRGGLDEATLEGALRELVRRNPALRTAIFSQGLNEPIQVVREQVEATLERHDLSHLPEPERQARLDAHLEAQRQRGLAITAAPLIRLALFGSSPGEGTLVFGYHPLVLDAASARLCVRELLLLYKAAREGTDPGLERGRPFREYIAWLEQQDLRAAEEHFRRALRGIRPTELPGPAPAVAPEGGHALYVLQQLVLSPTATGNLKTLLRQHKLGLDTMLQAAWALLLRPGGGDAVFGAVVSGRPASLARAESMVGRLANTLPRRVAVPASGPLLRWLRDLQAELAEARHHEHASMLQIRQWIDAPQDAPLFQSAVVIPPPEEDALQPLTRSLGFHGPTHTVTGGPAPLVVSAVPGARLTLRLLHDPQRFEPAPITQMAARLGALVEAIAARPDQELAALAALASAPGLDDGGGAAAGRGTGGGDPGIVALEAVLAQHPHVRQVEVRAVEGASGPELLAHIVPARRPGAERIRKLRFGLFYFADEADGAGDKYRVYLEGAKFADRHGFNAVWTPERHFHAHGGLYPNPSVLSAALATITERVSLRAGSVVLPLHHPLRIAEEWSIVDNLSKGRAAISITSGWVPNDFAFAPDHYAKKREVMFQTLEEVQQLWRGGTLAVKDGAGKTAELRVFPRPIQPRLPIWMTCAGSPDLFVKAGELGVNILTSLLAQSLEEAAEKIKLYREARARAGHDPAAGVVSLMLHTFVGPDPDEVLEKVRAPLTAYLRSHVDLMKTMVKSLDMQVDINEPRWLDYLADFAFERYYRTSALIGTPISCYAMVERLAAADVDEVASFIDFGVESDAVLAGLPHLNALKQMVEDEALLVARLLSEYLGERLPGFRRPVSFRLVEALPPAPAGDTARPPTSA